MSLKSKLLNPKAPEPVVTAMFGGDFPVAKMTTAELTKVDNKMAALREEGETEKINLYTALTILNSMVDEKGKRMSESVEPLDLLNRYEPGAISDALNAVYRVNYAGMEGAEDAKKD